ncbi:MAG: hypothetical protein M1378_09795 [Bacteroidetes bacterium]|nr:hypothetical protein [Bacteroidota bacterium]
MAKENITFDSFKVLQKVKVPLLITDSDLTLIYANEYAVETLPLILRPGEKIEVDEFLQHEDSPGFDHMASECKIQGGSVGTLKQRGVEKYYRVVAYQMNGDEGGIVFQFDDISQLRILENHMYEHLIDLYNQLEALQREITELRARALRS